MRSKLSISSAAAMIGLSAFALAGDPKAPIEMAPAPAPSCPWTLQAALLYMEADSEDSSGYEDQDYEFGYRISLGYQADENSWGYRLRYFDFEGTSGSSSEEGPEISAVDLEGFRNLSLGSWHGEWSVGLRYLEVYEPYSGGADVDYTGWGPVVGIDLARELGGAYSIYVTGRAAYLFGDDDEDEAADETPVVELGLGIQRELNIGNCDGHVRLGVEGHRYFDLAYGETDADLFGGVLAFGFGF